MSVVDLVVLGLLLDEPMNAYRLARIIDERQLGRLVKISKPVVYKSCKRLGKGGYLDGESRRETEMPEKVVYTVNGSGREHFRQLMLHFSSRITPVHFEFNSFVWNLRHLEPAAATEMLQALQKELQTWLHWLGVHEREDVQGEDFGVRMVVKHYRMMLTAQVNWIHQVIAEYRQQKGETK
ncbi:MAG: PadR family transcriptional regulator [bacterium]